MTSPDATPPYRLIRGRRPLLLSIPHVGTHIPESLRGDYTDTALQLADTDWHLDRLKALHGQVLLWDAHSIASRLPRLFDDKLPDLNLDTASSASCAPELLAPVAAVAQASGYTSVSNGRFKGGHITRHYGRPADRVHAIQLELCHCLYMDERIPFDYEHAHADRLQPALKAMVGAALAALPA
jgi:N-formylglutamate deformylase